MNFERFIEGDVVRYAIAGRVDSNTAPILDEELKKGIENVTNLVIDLEKLEYTSSAGLRVFLATYKTMSKQGSLVFINVSDAVKEIFDLTGMSDFFTIK